MILRRLIPQLVLSATLLFAQKQKVVKPGFNLFSMEQDVQLGREAAAQIEREMQIVNNPRLTGLIDRIGRKLMAANAADGKNGQFPFTFKVVNDPSINAFALPGGPMFIQTGLIAAADNEGQVAGVMGHEMAHVILRHGTNQASKANLIQLPLAVAGGMVGDNSMLGTLAQLGIGLGANSVLMKFSRNAESDADLLGARLLHAAGYNPVELARFFEKLEAESGKGNAVTQFFASHPNPGNRVKNIQADMQFYPRANYQPDAPSADFLAAKAEAKALPAPPRRPQQSGTAPAPQNGGPSPDTAAPRGFRVQRTPLYAMAYPEDWQSQLAQDQVSLTLAAADGLVRGQNGQNDVGHGVLVAINQVRSQNLDQETETLVRGLLQGNPGVRQKGSVQRLRVSGQAANLVPLEGQSGMKRGEKEVIRVLTVMHPQGLFHAVLVAPESRWRIAEGEYDEMIRSIRF
jgi:Zn-dependent protease with chaperone function